MRKHRRGNDRNGEARLQSRRGLHLRAAEHLQAQRKDQRTRVLDGRYHLYARGRNLPHDGGHAVQGLYLRIVRPHHEVGSPWPCEEKGGAQLQRVSRLLLELLCRRLCGSAEVRLHCAAEPEAEHRRDAAADRGSDSCGRGDQPELEQLRQENRHRRCKRSRHAHQGGQRDHHGQNRERQVRHCEDHRGRSLQAHRCEAGSDRHGDPEDGRDADPESDPVPRDGAGGL